VGTILNTPFDVVKTRIQNQVNRPGIVSKYNWALPSLGTIMREEG
jgi:solute carrier family 25 (mitochondrial 2-oxodicarboxylate transporter), member 21